MPIAPDVLREYDFELLDLFHEINDRLFNPPLPQNTDADPLVFHKPVFDLKVSLQTTFDALKRLSLDEPAEDLLADATRGAGNDLTRVRFAWKKRDDKKHAAWNNAVLGWIKIEGGRLAAEVNSDARAKEIRKTIEKILGENVHYRASEIQSPEKMLAEQRAAGEDMGTEEHNKLAEDRQVREMASGMMAKHWGHWVEQPIPMLADRTPMEAVKDSDGREKVEAIVMQAERAANGPGSQTNPEVSKGCAGGWACPAAETEGRPKPILCIYGIER